jgi:hypothetical protein
VGVSADLQRSLREPRRCLGLAYSLSLHLIRMYSTSWLTVVFFPYHDKNLFYAWTNATPYLFPSCKIQCGRVLSQVRAIKHPRVFALGGLILELDPCSGMDTELSGEEFYGDVTKRANTDEVRRRMGRKYAEIVRRCLYFYISETNSDCNSPTVQKAFVERIVGPLGQYTASFDGFPIIISAR